MTSRRLLIAGHDLLATALALVGSFVLRWGGAEFLARLEPILIVCALTLPFAAASYRFFRLDRSPWKYVSITDLNRIGLAVAVPAAFLVLVDFLSRGQLVVPRTVPVIYWLVQVALLAGPRVAYRLYRSRRSERRALRNAYRMPVLIAGADDEADQLVARLRRDPVNPLEPVGILATKTRHVGERIREVPVLGRLTDLEAVLRQLEIRRVRPRRLILTRDALRDPAVDEILATARHLGLAAVRPSQTLADVGSPDARVTWAPVAIDDLLGRSSHDLDMSPVRALLAGRRVLVTGGGGSIGSELCRQAAALGATEILLFDQSELALSTTSRELEALHPGLPVRTVLGSVSDPDDLRRAFGRFRPHLVFHAAALKHVDLVEAHPVAAARTNTLGTDEVANAAVTAGVECAVFISTDKAVDPVSVLGATKRAGELAWAVHDRRCRDTGRPTRLLTVRFGNVLGSSGSVIPLFTEQLRRGGPITVTHPEVERFFMTISEAVRLVLLASTLGIGASARSPTFVLDMGEPIRIIDLARRMIRLAGLEPEVDVAVTFSGLRPGERLSEVLEFGGEDLVPTEIAGIRATQVSLPDEAKVATGLDALRAAVSSGCEADVLAALDGIVPEYAGRMRVPA